MKKIVNSTLLVLLATSMVSASPLITPEQKLETAIVRGDVQRVQEILSSSSCDVNKGLGTDLKPALMLAIEKLGAELKEHGHDIAWYLIATGFGAFALAGLHKLLSESDITVMIEHQPHHEDEAEQVVAQAIRVDAVEPEIQPVAEAPKTAPQKPREVTTLKSKKSPRDKIIDGALKVVGGITGFVGSLKKGKKPTKKIRTAAVEDRLKIVQLLAEQPEANIFAADVHGRNSLDAVITFLSNYTEGSECYTCMKEVQESITKNKTAESLYVAWLAEELELDDLIDDRTVDLEDDAEVVEEFSCGNCDPLY